MSLAVNSFSASLAAPIGYEEKWGKGRGAVSEGHIKNEQSKGVEGSLKEVSKRHNTRQSKGMNK